MLHGVFCDGIEGTERLVEQGHLRGKGGAGDDLILELSEDTVRLLVVMDRAGVFGREPAPLR